jgi:hypothetical protein
MLTTFPSSVEGYLTEPEGFALLVLACAAPAGDVVELGTYKGRSAICLAQSGRTVVCVDHFEGERFDAGAEGAIPYPDHLSGGYYDALVANLKEHGGTYQVIAAPTAVAGDAYAGEGVALLFLDAAHDYEAVRQDWEAWRDHLIPDGLAVFHDREFAGVGRLLLEIEAAGGWTRRDIPDTALAVVRRADA